MRNRGVKLKSLLQGVGLLSVFPLSWLVTELWPDSSISVCIFRMITKTECPFCGLTRAFACIWKSDFSGAANLHPLWWLAAGIIWITASIKISQGILGEKKTFRYLLNSRTCMYCMFGFSFLTVLIRSGLLH